MRSTVWSASRSTSVTSSPASARPQIGTGWSRCSTMPAPYDARHLHFAVRGGREQQEQRYTADCCHGPDCLHTISFTLRCGPAETVHTQGFSDMARLSAVLHGPCRLFVVMSHPLRRATLPVDHGWSTTACRPPNEGGVRAGDARLRRRSATAAPGCIRDRRRCALPRDGCRGGGLPVATESSAVGVGRARRAHAVVHAQQPLLPVVEERQPLRREPLVRVDLGSA